MKLSDYFKNSINFNFDVKKKLNLKKYFKKFILLKIFFFL
jgi:hypothetical protein